MKAKNKEQIQRETAQFFTLRFGAAQALKKWAISVLKEAILTIPKSIDQKYKE